ncbi:hypothetical protein CLV91_3394 [Maribacter vaceletii]|uniref:Uncharacterized protein n=1 Tax=Maribacter vaceletii TaxID=1206816 RepID=A0A495DRS2_9FLAO|nr:hypothetical protein [Maribacter vaceletii]RKR06434.1 hypothetical protein CLV91_3394 [Maribacter vaceletii]
MENLKNKLKNFSLEELKALYTPISREISTFDTTFDLEYEESFIKENGQQSKRTTKARARLRGSIDRKCYVVYARYKYKAKVTVNGKPFKVDSIIARMNSGNDDFTKKVNNNSELNKTDKVYEYGVACKASWMIATAKKGNSTGRVRVDLKL